MADKKKLKAPSGMAGLVRYEEGAESKFKMEPKIVVFIAISIIILELVLFSLF